MITIKVTVGQNRNFYVMSNEHVVCDTHLAQCITILC